MDGVIRTWNGETVITRYLSDSDTWMFIAIHSTALGIATGGTRFKRYPTPQEALMDAMRLAEGMTYKWAGIDFPRGGGKAVLYPGKDLQPDERKELFSTFGTWLADLRGVFETGPDLGTSSTDMDVIRKSYSGVFGCTKEAGGQGDPGPFTALGVFSGIQASCARVFGTPKLRDRSIIVQGAGSVGEPLMRYLLDEGCEVRFTDVDEDRIRMIREKYDLDFVQSEDVYGEPCDVFVPCATGGVLNSETIPLLRCSIVAGGANNQLKNPDDAERIREKGILYAPDFIINAGGALYLLSVESMGWTVDQARTEIQKIGESLNQIYATSDELEIDTGRAAVQLAANRIKAATGEP